MSTTVKYVERTDVKLETQADCWKALMDGLVLFNTFNFTRVKLVDGFIFDIEGQEPDADWSFSGPLAWGVYQEVETPWYETVTFPLLCWATKEKNYPVMIISYEMSKPSDSGTVIPIFKTEITTWTDVSPITQEDFEKLNGQLNSSK